MLKKLVLATFLYFPAASAFAQGTIAAERVTFEGPGGNVGAFAQTATITRVEVGAQGVNVEFDKKNVWPNQRTPGWDGDLQYSIGFVLSVGGQLYGSAPIENWHDRRDGTGPIQNQSVTCASGTGQIHCNLFYDARWPNLSKAHPNPGDEIGLFVVAGDARNAFFTVRERSQIVSFPLPSPGATATFEYGITVPPIPVVVPQAGDVTKIDLDLLRADLSNQIAALRQTVNAMIVRASSLESDVTALKARVIPVSCRAALNLGATRIPVSCSLVQ